VEEKLREYAHLIVSVGLNLQKGQTLILSSPVECAPFARLCASAAYDLGAGEVVLNWTDDYITRERFLRAQDAAFEMPRPWRRAFFTDYANEGAAYLRIDAEDPETLLGVSPVRLVAAQRTDDGAGLFALAKAIRHDVHIVPKVGRNGEQDILFHACSFLMRAMSVPG